MKKIHYLLFIFLTLLCAQIHGKEICSEQYKNSIQFHPLFPVGIIEHVYLVEVDYVRTLNDKLSLLVRVKGKYDELLYRYGLEANDQRGRHIRGEVEIGIRRNFFWVNKERAAFGPYIQFSSSNGYQDLYYEEYEDIGTIDEENYVLYEIVDFKGYSGTAGVTGGLLFQKEELILSVDLGLGLKFYHLPELPAGPGFLKPNISLGFRF